MKVLFCVGLALGAPGLYAQSVPAPVVSNPTSLSLVECRTLALGQNQRLTASGRRQLAAEAGRDAANTNRLPKLDFSSTSYYVRGLGSTLNTQGATAGVGVTQPIYSGGRLRTQTALAGLTAQAAAEEVQATRQQLVVETDQAYWQTVALREQVVLAERNCAQLQVLARDLTTKLAAGLAYKADVLRAQVQLREAEVQLLRTRDNQHQSQLVLRQLIGRPAGDSLRLTESLEGAFPVVSPGRLRRAGPDATARFAPARPE